MWGPKSEKFNIYLFKTYWEYSLWQATQYVLGQIKKYEEISYLQKVMEKTRSNYSFCEFTLHNLSETCAF